MPTKILSVDDSPTVRLVVARAFDPYDCEMREAADGEQGLAAVLYEKPNLIILDVMMPTMDGLTMLRRIRADPAFSAIPVIMLTAETCDETLRQFAELGVADYLSKPFKEAELAKRAGAVVLLREKNPTCSHAHSASLRT
jgi:two-component system, cell cycle response regulator